MPRTAHRTFVSYIDKSRRYYAAQGYPHPYRWAVADTVAFTSPRVRLDAARVGVVTTAYFPPGAEPTGVPAMTGSTPPVKQPYAAPTADAAGATYTHDLAWAKDETHTEDPETYLPVATLQHFVAEGRLGSVSPRFYGVPTEYSQRRSRERDAPAVEEWMRRDEVDLALLVGL